MIGRGLLALAVALTACRSRPDLPLPSVPLTPTPDAPFRAAPPPFDAASHLLTPQVRTGELANGMTLLVVERPELPTVSIAFVSRDARDEDDQPGLAALTASLLNRGTRLSNGDIEGRLTLGGRTPAIHADGDGTWIRVTTLSSAVDKAVSLFADLARRPVLDAVAVDVAKQDAQNGMFRMSLDINRQLTRTALGELYGFAAPVTVSVLGAADVTTFSRAHVRRFHETRYGPRGSALVAVGATTLDELARVADRHFGDWPSQSDEPKPPEARPPTAKSTSGWIQALSGDDLQARFTIIFPCVPALHPDGAPLDLAAMVLAGLQLSRARSAIRHQEGIAYAIDASCSQFRDHGLFWIRFSADTYRAAEALEMVLEEVARLRSEPVGPRELDTAKQRLFGVYSHLFSSNEDTRDAVAMHFSRRMPLTRIETLGEEILAVTAEDLRKAVLTHLRVDRMSVAVYGDRQHLGQTFPHVSGMRGVTWWDLRSRPDGVDRKK